MRLLRLLVCVCLFPWPVLAATLVWEPPTTLENGQPITSGILSYGVSRSDTQTGPKTPMGQPTSPSFPLDDADRGKWFHVSAVGPGGEGAPASIVWLAPGQVLNLRIQGGTLAIVP
jgi:hypothetical protein